LPTLSADITRVAELVVNLEEKVDNIEETIEWVKKPNYAGRCANGKNSEYGAAVEPDRDKAG